MPKDCFYCTKDAKLDALMIELSRFPASTLYLSKDQTNPGRCIIALNDHQTELFYLEPSIRQQFMEDVSKCAYAIQQAFSPDKMNYAIYGDLVSHLHVHLVPKYKTGNDWGRAFNNNTDNINMLSTAAYLSLIERIKVYLK
ncbi:histidine triad (HIT) protein [Paenibacillus elgii]|uniref:Histidine triad (HIT) protein n=1 Tax=Paenibacillus elgii TaxID=189691 RepID=A0A163WC60_9BACL|nr:HIT family protein [Paenibacillus elgii]KZE76153.1 histidine triad (HIT) protein [Paenibacillus elgii]